MIKSFFLAMFALCVVSEKQYATFFTGLTCQLKILPGAMKFFRGHLQEYPDMIQAEVTGNARIKIYKTAEDRDASVVDAGRLSVEELTAMLANGLRQPEVIATIDLTTGLTVDEIHAELKKHNVLRIPQNPLDKAEL